MRWTFTAANARAAYAEFFADRADLVRIPWEAVANSDFRSEAVKEAKQAEFLIRDRFPWSFVESVGVRSQTV